MSKSTPLCFATMCCVLSLPCHSMGLHLPAEKQQVERTVGVGKGLMRRSDSATGVLAVESVAALAQHPHTRRRRGTVDMEFGGRIQGEDRGGELERPQFVKAERCDSDCHLCPDEKADGCWYGVKKVGQETADMALSVKANSDFSSFVQEVFLCASSSAGRYRLVVDHLNNGKIAVYVNSVRQGAFFIQHPGSYPFAITAGTEARVRAVFVPLDKSLTSNAVAKVETQFIDESVENCMTGKLCMNELGDGSLAAYKLRNDNNLQYKCLEAGASSLDSSLQSVCTEWDACLPADSKKILKVLLKISGASLSSSSLADKVSGHGNHTPSVDPNECINPAVDDPESWDCECAEDMTNICGGVDETCFKGILCAKAQICQSWKDEAECPSALIEKNEYKIVVTRSGEASGQRSHETSSSGSATSLDGSLQGKCTAETQ